jgi:hypothetical protein
VALKRDTTKDLLTIFSQSVVVKFKKDNQSEKKKGRWCLPCRAALNEKGQRNAFFTGGNSTCRAHIRQHYTLYKERCKEANIPENHHAIPRPLWNKMQEEKAKGKKQTTLDGLLKNVPKEFTRDGILRAVSQFIACGDQVRLSKLLALILLTLR